MLCQALLAALPGEVLTMNALSLALQVPASRETEPEQSWESLQPHDWR